MKGVLLWLAVAVMARANVVNITTRGPSMLPTLPVEATVLRVDTDSRAFDRVTVGSVVIVRVRGVLTTHRVFRQIAPGVYWTKGDNWRACRFADADYLTAETFVGLVVSPLPANPHDTTTGRGVLTLGTIEVSPQ